MFTRHHVEILIGQDIWRKIQEVQPTPDGWRFIDWKSYRMGRLQSEMRSEYKEFAFGEALAKTGEEK